MALVIYARDADLLTQAQVEDYLQITINPVFNDVGTWELLLDASSPSLDFLLVPNAGIRVLLDGVLLMSGPVTKTTYARQGDATTFTVNGASDDIWLKRRVAHMQPASTAPPYSTQAYDVRTNAASQAIREYVDANAGPSAISVRRVPHLVIGADLPGTPTITGKARMQVLADLVTDLSLQAGGLGWRVVQVDQTLEFQVYQPTDKSGSVKFAPELGNLGDFSLEQGAPEVTYVYVGGGGADTARTFIEGSDADTLSAYGRYEEFHDRSDTSDGLTIAQTIEQELAEKTQSTVLSITPFDTDQQKYGVHYGLGDKVSVVVGGRPISETIRKVTLTYTADGPITIQSDITSPNRTDAFEVFRQLRDLKYRVTNIERR